MKKWIWRLLLLMFSAVFLISAGLLAMILNQYQTDEKFYDDAAEEYMNSPDVGGYETVTAAETEEAPIWVDFDSLKEVNSDIIGWIYCEGTPINYPVLQGENNDVYLHHTYDGGYSAAGSIFADAANRPGFVDANTIIYGHNMKNGSMFQTLSKWLDQDFYEEHPVMWLLTEEQDYKIVLFSGYATSAYSDTYTIFTGPCEKMDEYLKKSVEQSEFQADVELDLNGSYVLLSTCAYMFENARYVLHGMLVPVGEVRADGAGGIST